MKTVSVIGMGYIGLPTAMMFASQGVSVIGTDCNAKKIRSLQDGNLPIDEDGMDELFQKALDHGIRFSENFQIADVYIIAVPTPYNKESKKIDPSMVLSAFRSVLEVCPENAILVLESTVSPGTIDKYVRPLIAEYSEKKVNLAHAPERIIPGNMVYELWNNSRTIGADNPSVGESIKELYQKICRSEITVTDIRTAEMTKVIENTYRDVNIAFANEVLKLCNAAGMNAYEIIRIANKHPRVNILSPGPGVGGHCISVDPWFLVGDFPMYTNLIKQARLINDGMPEYVLRRIREVMKQEGLKDLSRIGLYGLTYKENVDDMRESPSLQLLESMENHLASGLKVYDPFIKEQVADNQYFDLPSFLNDVDMVVIMVGHDEIKQNFELLNKKIVLDTRHICSADGIYYL